MTRDILLVIGFGLLCAALSTAVFATLEHFRHRRTMQALRDKFNTQHPPRHTT